LTVLVIRGSIGELEEDMRTEDKQDKAITDDIWWEFFLLYRKVVTDYVNVSTCTTAEAAELIRPGVLASIERSLRKIESEIVQELGH
jgi:hypothetical protein